jgi:hypothetical protein
VAQERTTLRDSAHRGTVAKLIQAVQGWGGFPLLQRKLQDMFRRDAAGLRDPVLRQVARTCVVPLLERTVDEAGLYPCSIYKRHAGAPIAPASLGLAEQQAAIHAWALAHDCRRDPICVQHCVGCTKQLNVEANRLLDHLEPSRPLPVRQRHALLPRPYLVVKPLGLPRLRRILRYLRSQGVGLRAVRRLTGWQSLAARLHKREAGPQLRLESRAYAALEKGDEACWLQLQGPLPWGKLLRLKAELRTLFPGREAVLDLGQELKHLRSSVVHAPEPGDEAGEWELLEQAAAGA